MEPKTIVIIAAICGFVLISVLILINYLIARSKVLFKDRLLIIKHEDLTKDQIKSIKKYLPEITFYIIEVYFMLKDHVKINYDIVKRVTITIQPKVFINGKQCKGSSNHSGHYCYIEYGDEQQIKSLIKHEVGHSIIQQNHLDLSTEEQHNIMAKLGF